MDMYRNSYVVKGISPYTSGNVLAECLIEKRKADEVLDGSGASGYGVAIGAFAALCQRTSSSGNSDPAKISEEGDRLADTCEGAQEEQAEPRIGEAISEEGVVSERQAVATNRMAQEDLRAGSTDHPVPTAVALCSSVPARARMFSARLIIRS